MGTNRKLENRRTFFQTSAALLGGALLSSLIKPIEAISGTNQEEELKNEKEDLPLWGMGVDIEKCVGCGKCAEACKIENNVPLEPFYFRTWIEHYTVNNDGEVKIESLNGGIGGLEQSLEDEDI